MKNRALLFLGSLIFLSSSCWAQFYQQYFDGSDTSILTSVFAELDTSSSNVWQIGSPQKSIFNAPSSPPNVLVTDTLNFYPPNTHSSFLMGIPRVPFFSGILALSYNQKLDFEMQKDGGTIEYSVDTGSTWFNVMNSPYTYNFYGFQPQNIDTLPNGMIGFTGTDSTWQNIWLCFDISWLSFSDSLMLRFTLHSDSSNNKEGWMIDNFLVQRTIIHTINEKKETEYLRISPNPTAERIHIEATKIAGFHIIETLQLVNLKGQVVEDWTNSPTKFDIDVSAHPPGTYFLRIQTNIKTEVHKLIIK